MTDALGLMNAILTAGFEERGKKIATRSYNVLLLIALGMVATLVFSVINRDQGLCTWLLGFSLVEGIFSALYIYVIRKEWALSRKAKMMITYDASKCYLVIDQEELRVEMSPKFFWTKKVAHMFMGTKFRDEDESKEDGNYRMERKKDQMKVFCDGELLYEFEVPSYVDLVTLYFPPRMA